MRKNRLLITVAALGSAASIAAMTAPAMATPATTAIATSAVVRAAEHGTPGAVQDVTNPVAVRQPSSLQRSRSAPRRCRGASCVLTKTDRLDNTNG